MSPRPSWPVGAVIVLMLAACGQPPPPLADTVQPTKTPAATPAPAATPSARAGAFSRNRLIEDARQLADILESAHPDPYINGGGKIAFHRRLHRVLNAIPEEGMTRDEFYRLLRPFVAGVGDAHTGIRGMVPVIAATHFPPGSPKAHVLPVDYPLTYERLASYGFDPNAEYLVALDLL